MMPMDRGGKGAVIMKVLEARKAMPAPEYDGGGDFVSKAKGHCEQGLSMAKEYLDGEDGQDPALRPKVEALAAAYEDLLSSLADGAENEE